MGIGALMIDYVHRLAGFPQTWKTWNCQGIL